MSSRLRVCLVTPYDLIEEGGVKRHVFHLADELRRLGDEVEVLGPYSGHAPLPPGTTGFRGVVNIQAGGSHNHLAIFARPWEVLERVRGRFDVLHVHEPAQPSLAWYAAWFAGTAARIATFHAHVEDEGPALRAARRWLCRPQLALFDRGIAVSSAAARYAAPYWPGPLEIIPNGVDTSVFHPAPAIALAAGPAPFRLLFVGQWRDPRKGLTPLLDAHALLRARGIEATLDVVGLGDPASRRDAPGVTYHGHVSSEETLAGFYHRCDVFVAPSIGQESFGIVLLEAMGCGRPVVCSDIAGYREVAVPDGARLVPPADPPALAAAIEALARDPAARRAMGQRNLAEAARYDWARVTPRVREEYLRALARRP